MLALSILGGLEIIAPTDVNSINKKFCAWMGNVDIANIPDANALYFQIRYADYYYLQIGVAMGANVLYMRTKWANVWRTWWHTELTQII